MHKNRGEMNLRKMPGSWLLGLAGRMQRKQQQQESSRDAGFFRSEHARLPAAVGMAAEINLAGRKSAHRLSRASQSRSVRGGHPGRWRPPGPLLAERQVATKNAYAFAAKGVRHRRQKRRTAIAAGAVRQNQTAFGAARGQMQKSPNVSLLERDAVSRLRHCWVASRYLRNRTRSIRPRA